MAANFGFNNLKVEAIGQKVTIPNDDVAKLMYYLSCVDTVINYNEIDRLTDYENYDLLSVDGMAELFKLVLLFNPKIFIDAGIFILDPVLVPDDSDNEFYQITDERIGIHVNSEIVIGGRTVKVLKVMACNLDWLNTFYFEPWKNIFEAAEREKEMYLPPPPPPQIIYVPVAVPVQTNQNYMPNQQNQNNTYKSQNESYLSDSFSTKRRKQSDGCCCLII
jgi:hypothetical protein